MLRYLAGRLLFSLVALWVLTLVTFILGAMAPGGPVEVILGQHADPAAIARLKKERGLNDPLPVQYGRWLGGVLKGDFGISFRDQQPITPTLKERYPVTVRLALMAGLFALLAGGILGLAAALRPGGWIDRTATFLSTTGISLPAFVVLPLLVLLFSLRLKIFPATYGGELWHLVLPAIALACRPAALIARVTRAAFLETLEQDYVRTAKARGAGPLRVLIRHAGRNALIPILTVLGASVGYLLGGSFVVETIFAVPGIGEISVASIPARDYPMIQAVVLLGATVFILTNLLVDLLYGLIDPRLRAGVPAR